MKHATFGRFISVLLAFVMVIGEVPVYASADVPPAGEIRAIEDNGNISEWISSDIGFILRIPVK